MFCVSRVLLLIGGITFGVLFASMPLTSLWQGGSVYTATSTGFVSEDRLAQEQRIFDHLFVRASAVPDDFGRVAALLLAVARDRAFTLAGAHQLASTIDAHVGGSAGIHHALATAADDICALISAHLHFKRLADRNDQPSSSQPAVT